MYAEFGHKFSQLSKEITHSQVREHPLMMSDFMGGSKMTPQNRTLEDKNRALGERRVKNDQKNRTSFMDVPLSSNFAKLKAADSQATTYLQSTRLGKKKLI